MEMIMVFALAGAAAANSAAPGPCILVASSRAATVGLWSGIRVTIGVAASDVVLLVFAWAIIVGTLTLSGAAQETLQYGGLALLVLLALMMLSARHEDDAGLAFMGRFRLGDGALGLALGLSSPLNLLFMFALLPQFVNIEQLDAFGMALASSAVLAGGALPLMAACFFAARTVGSVRQMAVTINRACGGALLGFAGMALVAGP